MSMPDRTLQNLNSYPSKYGPLPAGAAFTVGSPIFAVSRDRSTTGPRMGSNRGPGSFLNDYADALRNKHVRPNDKKLNDFISDIRRAEEQIFGGGGQSNVSPGFSQSVGQGIGSAFGSLFSGGGQSNISPFGSNMPLPSVAQHGIGQGIGQGIGSVFGSLFSGGGQSNMSPFGSPLQSFAEGGRVPELSELEVPVTSVSDGDPSLTFEEEVLSDYARLEELRNNIDDESSAVEMRELENFQNILLSKYGSFGEFERLLSEALPEYKAVFDASRKFYSNLLEDAGAVNTLNREAPAENVFPLNREAPAEDVFPLDLEYPAKDDVARATAYGSSGGIGAYAAEPKEGSVSPVTMTRRPESRAQVRSPRPIRAPGGALLNNTEYLAVPEYMQRPDYFDFNPSAGADFTQQLLARAAEEKAGGFSNLV